MRKKKNKAQIPQEPTGNNIGSTNVNFIWEVKNMYTVFMKGDSNIFQSGFTSWQEADRYGKLWFGPGGYEIEQE